MAKPKRPLMDDSENKSEIPIPNLPKKYLSMHVKSGTKIRNVLGYALREFPNYRAVVWSGAGQGIGKVISCAELFKRKISPSELHQVTKLRYVESKNSSIEPRNENDKIHRVPEIHILLSRETTNTKEPGYQPPGDVGQFSSSDNEGLSKESRKDLQQIQSSSKEAEIAIEKLAVAVGLRMGHTRTGQKRPMKKQQADGPPKKNKKKGSDAR